MENKEYRKVRKIVEKPMVDWEASVDAIPERRMNNYAVVDEFDAEIERLMRFREYFIWRRGNGAGDHKHAFAVTKQNIAARRVRRILGFTIARNDVRF